MEQSFLKKPQFWLGIIISVACLIAIFAIIDPVEIANALRSADYRFLLAALVFMFLYMLMRAIRWRFMLEDEIKLSELFHIQNIGYMLTQILPLRLGDPARAILVGNVPPITVGRGLSTMVVERILDMVTIVTLLPFTLAAVETLPDWMRQGARASGFAAFLGIGVIIVAANFRPKFAQILTAILDKIPFLNTNTWVERIDSLLAGLVTLTAWRSGIKLVVLSAIVWVPIIIAYQLFMYAVGLEPSFMIAAFVVCAGAFSIAIPSSPGQVGVFHAGVITAITLIGMNETAAASFAFLYHTFNFLFLVALGLFGLSQTQATFGKVIEATRSFVGQKK